MSRIKKAQEQKKIKHTFIYPIIIFIVTAVVLIIIVDYRINSTMGLGKVRVININTKDRAAVTVCLLGHQLVKVNTIYLKKDINKLKEYAETVFDEIYYSAKQVVKQEYLGIQ